MRLKNIDAASTANALSQLAVDIKQILTQQNLNPDELCNMITDGIYNTCKENRVKKDSPSSDIQFNPNCSSRNFKAIADINLQMYQQLMKEGRSEAEYTVYMETWIEAQRMAEKHEEQEFNTRKNKRWNSCKKDGRTLWSSTGKEKVLNTRRRKLPRRQYKTTSEVFSNPQRS